MTDTTKSDNMTDDPLVIPAPYIMELYERYQDMVQACLIVKEAIIKDGDRYPVCMPTYDQSNEACYRVRVAAAESITQLYYPKEGEEFYRAGILCASPDTVAAVEQINDSKYHFKKAVMDIRKFGKKEKGVDLPTSRFTNTINEQITNKGFRCETLKKAMGTAGISALELQRCYSLIRVLPPALQAFSWTWATTHTRVEKTTVAEVKKDVEAIEHTTTKEAMLAALEQCSADEPLVRKVRLPNQLRANYSYLNSEGEISRKSCTISGVVIAQQNHLPRYLWRDNPGQVNDSMRLERLSGIYSEPIIKVLGIYRYDPRKK